MPDQEFWKRKLMAFLHDPPHKPYGIANHKETVKSNILAFFDSVENSVFDFDAKADHIASAADRFCFPNPRKNWPEKNGYPLRTDWKGEGCPFIHPFCGSILKPHKRPVTDSVAADWMSKALDGCAISRGQKPDDFIKAWRLWCDKLVKFHGDAGKYMPYLVADTRIPDHTIWQHNSLVSALANCGNTPSFLIFQIGPVQSFISHAKKTNDLWAGSYILSFLLAKGMEAVIRKYGPDHFIFPQLRGNPIMDKLLWDIYGEYLDFTVEAENHWRSRQLLTPCMPNRFLTVFSEEDAQKAADLANMTIENTWKEIAKSCREYIVNNFTKINNFPGWDDLWDEQISEFPRIEYLIEPFESPDKTIKEFMSGNPPSDNNPDEHPVLLNYHWALNCIPDAFKDTRNYTKSDNMKWEINNLGFAWALNYMKTEWKFGALRNSRIFKQRKSFGNLASVESKKWQIEKDTLDGINEVIGGGKYKDFWSAIVIPGNWKDDIGKKRLFVGSQRYGAISIIKRLFDIAYLEKEYGFDTHKANDIKSTYEIATGRKIKCEEEEEQQIGENECGYYAVICLDGDNIGQWLSGKKAPPLCGQLSGKSIKDFFEDNWKSPDGIKIACKQVARVLTPSYHAAFSEALANFANYCVEPVISAYQGQLVYAGGDDVLAMAPAKEAVKCADDLQMAFRGLKPTDENSNMNDIFDYEWSEMERNEHVPGFLKLKKSGSSRPSYPLLLPGPKATVSCGIAIGHCKSPMQDLIQAARDAEKSAKNSGKDGFYVSVMKRSGETHSFFAHWEHSEDEKKYLADKDLAGQPHLFSVMEEMLASQEYKILSKGFIYKYCRLVAPLLRGHGGGWLEKFDDDMIAASEEFLRIAFERQGGMGKRDAEDCAKRIIQKMNLSSREITPEMFMNFWMALAFIQRLPERKGEADNA